MPKPTKQHDLAITKTKVEQLSVAQVLNLRRAVLKRCRRELQGQEYEHIRMLLQFLEPDDEFNNQRYTTYEYRLNNKRYAVTVGIGEDPIIEEILNDME